MCVNVCSRVCMCVHVCVTGWVGPCVYAGSGATFLYPPSQPDEWMKKSLFYLLLHTALGVGLASPESQLNPLPHLPTVP